MHFLESVVVEQLPFGYPYRQAAHPTSYRCPDPDEPGFEAMFPRYLTDVIVKSNFHTHTFTCYKYLKPGEKKVCRLGYGRVEVPETTISDAGDILT